MASFHIGTLQGSDVMDNWEERQISGQLVGKLNCTGSPIFRGVVMFFSV